jgi:hypothetical protein
MLFRGFDGLDDNGRMIVVRALLETLTLSNWQYMKRHPETPLLYEARPRYVVHPARGGDEWRDIAETFKRGAGTCKDFACIRVAELRMQGYEDVVPFIKLITYPDPKKRRPPLTLFHVLVRNGDEYEDPSSILGMPKNLSYAELRDHPDAGGIHGARWGLEQWASTSASP